MKQNFLQGLKLAAGITLVLIGLIGLVIPLLQGWLLIFAGIFLINPNLARKLKEKYHAWRERRKHPPSV